MIKEDFLHFVWRLQRFNQSDLKTTQGAPIQLINLGEYNLDAGPDFTNARIRIGDTLWAGNVEIHLQSSDWDRHNHGKDRAYDNVILHVVLEEDQPIFRKTGERLACLELKTRIPAKLSTTYLKISNNAHWIPCQHHFHEVPAVQRNLWLDRLMVERLEEKTREILVVLRQNKNDWEATFYQFLARNFGVKVNVEPFECLARSLPYRILGKHKNSLLQTEALLFGQAGLLEPAFEDDYPNKLKKEYRFLQKKYQLRSIPVTSWKFMRMRPANFPTIRIAQLAMLFFQTSHLFSKVLAIQNIKEIEHMFDLSISNYWKDHYVFDKRSVSRKKALGKSMIHLLTINTIAPFLFIYGKSKAEGTYQDKALQLLEELPAEKNSIIQKWKELGVEPESAYQTQALLQLKNEYCKKQKCLNCAVGGMILKG